MIVNGEVVAVAERVPAHVKGDGRLRLKELIEKENRNPMRGEGHEKALTKIFINEESERLIAEQGYSMDSVPEAGVTVWLKYTANISTGGTAVDRTDEIHHSNVETARRAARIIGLDIAGVDMLTTDITRPLEETGGAICEVNAAPGFRMHVHPTVGKSRDVAGAVLNMLLPAGVARARPRSRDHRDQRQDDHLAHARARAEDVRARRSALRLPTASTSDGKRILQGDLTGPWSAQMVLRDPTVDFAVLETARGGILRAGLGFDYCDIGAITNVSEDHLGLRGVETLEELAYVKAIVIEVVRRDGYSILNAEDPHLVPLAERARGTLCYFSLDADNEVLRNHLGQGGIGVTLRDHSIVIRRGSYDLPAINLNSIPATFNGRAMFNVANAMVAALAAHLSGVSLDDIRAGLKTFDTHFYLSPGRLNLEEVGDFHVLLDYAHNVAAYRNVAAFIAKLNVTRRVGVVAAAGDRRDIDIETMGRIAGGAFDRLIIKEDDNRRGREAGATAEIMKRGALASGLAPEAIEMCLDEPEAVERALGQAIKGDLVVITADDIKRTFDQIVKFRNERAARAVL